MAQRLYEENFDTIVVGAGASGVAAAIASARSGLRTVLIDTGTTVGGELISGMPLDGCLNVRGEWILGGIGRELIDSIRDFDGFAEPIFDWRQMWAVCVDPETFRLAILHKLIEAGVTLRLYTQVEDVITHDDVVTGVVAVTKGKRVVFRASAILDCSGDGDVATYAGAPTEVGSPQGTFQPVSLIFRMQGVDYGAILDYQRDHPEHFILCDNPLITETPAEAALKAHAAGFPFTALSGQAEGSPLTAAIADGRMYPTVAVHTAPTSPARTEVQINSTRAGANLGGLDTASLSASLGELTSQLWQCVEFCQAEFPGFERSVFAGAAPRVGVRETRRIVGEYQLTKEDVIEGRKSERGIAKGGHHIDIHELGTGQIRESVRDGNSYDIPYECLVPKRLANVLVAGRCLSSTREANGSARVMAACLAMGHAAGLAAAAFVKDDLSNFRQIDVSGLRARLVKQGAVLDGTA